MQQSLLSPVGDIARDAGRAIMQVYESSDFGIENKDDDSPLTKADLSAHRIIVEGLQTLTPGLPILSEESAAVPWDTRKRWQRYWLVDPLDGTKEFIKRNGEFTVNIALVEDGVPVLGVVYAPVLDWLYAGEAGRGALKTTPDGESRIECSRIEKGRGTLKVVASRTHRGETLDAWLAKVGEQFENVETVSMGSSLKICLVAEGEADIYPRLALTSEWDTAAAQAVLEAAGGVLLDVDRKVYRYNRKDDILNPYFFAVCDKDFSFPEV